ncbi:FAD-dependent oxidoreductase [Nocardioides sp. W3-2-3]|nr:FAD-dependent oxidoreductase [Nocardioides convexus]
MSVVDPRPARGASYAAAGMLSPAAEVWYGEEEPAPPRARLAGACGRSLAGRLGVALWSEGTLLVGHDAGDLQQVERQAALLSRHGREVVALDRAGVREAEPSLARVAGGVLLPGEASVDPRAVCAALLERVRMVAGPGGADVTVVATGARLPEPWTGLVSGVRGRSCGCAPTTRRCARCAAGWPASRCTSCRAGTGGSCSARRPSGTTRRRCSPRAARCACSTPVAGSGRHWTAPSSSRAPPGTGPRRQTGCRSSVRAGSRASCWRRGTGGTASCSRR